MALLQEVLGAVRSMRADWGIGPGQRLNLTAIVPPGSVLEPLLATSREAFALMAWVPELTILSAPAERPRGTVSTLAAGAELCLHIGDAVDVAAELARLDKQIAKATQDVERSEKKLANKSFLEKAPDSVVAEEQKRLQEAQALLAKLTAQRHSLEQLGI